MKIPYNTSVVPPAPFIPVRVSNPIDETRSSDIPAKIDTGADLTVIPESLVRGLGLIPAGELEVEGFTGGPTVIRCYDVTLRVAELRLVNLPVIPHGEDYILLGRDALNSMRIVLDGPTQTLEV